MQFKQNILTKWKQFYTNSYKLKFQIIVIIKLVTVLLSFQYFFQFIEQREGIVLNDIFLQLISSKDVSVYIFLCIWIVVGLFFYNALLDPSLFYTFSIAYLLLCFARIITISLVPLNAPEGLIEIVDPLTNRVYGKEFITKDLFFSGHVSTQFLFYLCFQNKLLKRIALISTVLVAILVLIQHVHYTIDVVAAPLFTYAVFWLTTKIKKLPIFEYTDH